MEYEVEYDVPGRIPECGAIFMSNASTKRECFRRKLLGLPSAQANFVKQIKAGMVLFLFEFEKRELYGVFKACSDGSTNIVVHAFTSSGRQFPAQVRFTRIWYCDPLTEYEFQDAIKENYYSKKKFNFGLSEDQVRRLLCLFSSRKLQKPHRAFRRQVSKSVEKERSIASDDDCFLRNRAEEFVEDDNLLPGVEGKYPGKASDDDYILRNRAEEFVEDDSLVSGIDAKYPGKASSNNGRQLDSSRFIKSDGRHNDHNGNCCQGYGTLTEPPSVSFGKGRRGDDDDKFFVQNSMAYCDDLDQGQVIHIDSPGDSSVNSEREAEEHKFSLSKHFMGSNTGPIASPKYCWESLAKVGRATDNCRFSQGDILGDKYTPNQFFGLVTSMGHLENSGIKARRASDGHEFFADCGVENDYNFANYPHSADPPLNTCRLRISDKELFSGNDKKEIGHYVDDRMGEVRNERSDGNFLRRDRADVPSENFAKCLDSEGRANCHDWSLARLSIEHGNTLNSGYPLDKIKRVGDEGTLKKTDGLADAYTMQNSFRCPNFLASTSLSQSRQNNVFFSRNLDTKNSFCEDQPKVCSVLPSSMEQKTFDFSCPTYHDAMVTRTVPQNNGVPGIHCRNLSSFAVDCTSRSIQHMPQHQNSNGNCLAASLKRSLPYCSEAEDLSQCHDVASGFGNEVPLPTSPSYYTRSRFQTNTSLLSAEYHGKMEGKATGQEVHNGSQFPEPSSTSPHYSRSDMSDRRKGSPFSEFDKHALTSHGRYEENIPQYGTSQVEHASFNNTLPYLHSAIPNGKSNDWDSQYYYQNAKGKPTDYQSKRTSVFARLTSEAHAQESSEVSCLAEEESNFDLEYDKCDMGASVDQVMDKIFETMDHRVIKVRKSSLARKHSMVSDRLKMPSLKMEDDIEHVIDVNWNEIVEETRVVSFKRRSETKKIKDNIKEKTCVDTSEHEREGSVKKSGREVLEGMQHKRRKLVRPFFGKKLLQPDDGLSSDGSLTLPVSSSGHDDGTGNLDDLAKSRHNEDSSSPNCISVHLTSLSGGEGTNACIKQSLYRQGGKNEYNDGKEPFDGGTKRPSTSNLQVSCGKGFNAKENTGCCVGLTRSHESDDLSSQDVGLIHMTNPTIC